MVDEREHPPLRSAYPIAEDEKAAYREDGHILLRGVASRQEIGVWRGAIVEAAERHGQEARPMAERTAYEKAFLKGMNLWAKDAAARRFVLAPRFARIAAELMGVHGVRIYHDQALFKEPGGGPTPWHQDAYYWPLDTDHTVTMWMPLVDLTEEMGILTFASRSHGLGYLGTLPISDESEKVFDEYVRRNGFEVVRPRRLAAGDATFHSGWTLHAAPENASPAMREVMTIIYFADGARVTPPINPNQERDIARWLPGLRPGDLAASELNPIAYPSR